MARMKTRYLFLVYFLIASSLLGVAYYFQYARHLQPCPLCIMQRVAFYGIAVVSLIAFLHQRHQTKIYRILLLIFAVFGLAIAARQSWIQHFPPADLSTGCGPNLAFMLQNFPLSQVLKTLFYGSGDCALVPWTFLGLSMAEWSGLCFVGFTACILVQKNKNL
jgi:disulfide bond formation protein DsbB